VLADGDESGKAYLSELAVDGNGSVILLRWPDDWTIEDVVGWIVGGEDSTLLSIANALNRGITSAESFIGALKSKTRAEGGLKGDFLAYEAIADIIGARKPCRERANHAFRSIANVVMKGVDAAFIADENPGILVFQP
jgi:hypothetical protein